MKNSSFRALLKWAWVWEEELWDMLPCDRHGVLRQPLAAVGRARHSWTFWDGTGCNQAVLSASFFHLLSPLQAGVHFPQGRS